MAAFTNDQYLELLLIYGECNRNATEAARIFRERFPNVQHPSATTITRLLRRVRLSGSFHRGKPPGRPRTATNDDNAVGVLAAVNVNPHTSTRAIAGDSGLSRQSVQRILNRNNFHPFHLHYHQALEPQDYAVRFDYCNWITLQIENDERYLENIIWSDESQFSRDGVVNTHNAHYWSVKNPRWLIETKHQVNWRINVWCGIMNNELIGPVFYQGTLNGNRYRNMILEGVLAEFLDNLPLAQRRKAVFQHDGAPPHFARCSREYLDGILPNSWIGRGGPINWPARSPDLTPLDFFLWGHLKDVVYKSAPINQDDLMNRIRNACAAIPRPVFTSVQRSIRDRMLYCIVANGGHIEHVLK